MKKALTALLFLLLVPQAARSQTREDFTLGGLSAFLITPNTPAPGKPWIAYAPAISGLPEWHTGSEFETWMFDRYFAAGIAVAGIYSGDLSGSPAQRAGYTALYAEMVGNRGYATRFTFHVRSRGGLLGYNWAADNPGKVAAIGGIFPVTNLLSYPGAVTAASHYGISVTQLTTNDHLYNPIERLAPLFNAGVKIFHIHGDSDSLVPLNQNSQITKDRYDALGGVMTLKVIPGGGHDYSTYWSEDQDLTDFIIAEALAAADTSGPPTLNTLTPADDSVGVTTSGNLVAAFNKNIALKSGGTVTIRNLGPGANPDEVITIPDARLSISGSTLTINPAADLATSNHYAVRISANAISDLEATPNAFAGILNDTTWNFMTGGKQGATVLNPSFEIDNVADNGFIWTATAWTVAGDAGVLDLSASVSPQPTDGEQNGFANGGASLSQVTSHTIAAGTVYTLTVDVGEYEIFVGSMATVRLFGSTAGLGTALSNANGTAQLTGIAPAAGSYIHDVTVTYTALASGDPFEGQSLGIALIGQSGTQVFFDNVRLTATATPPSNTYANWILGYDAGGQTALDDDPDGDGIPNGVENFFGTDPGAFSKGLVAGAVNAGTFNFTHPLNATPADDLTAVYRWSTDLQTFYDDGDPNGAGTTTVTFAQGTPSNGMVTVTATISGAVIPVKLFVELQVTQ